MVKVNIYSNIGRTEFAIGCINGFFMLFQTAEDEDYPILEDSFETGTSVPSELKVVLDNWIKEHIIKNSEEDIINDKNNISEFVKVRINDKGLPDGFIIPCKFFRKGGKWYMDENVIIPLDTPTHNIREAIKNNRRINEFITTGTDLYGVPFLVSAEDD